jgi:hypothetical protein
VTALARAVVGLLSAYFALWACAPAVTMRAPVPMTADQDLEVGFAGAWTGCASGEFGCTDLFAGQGPDGQFWFSRTIAPKVQLGFVGGLGLTQAVSFGGWGRFHLVQTDRFASGVDLEAGWLWAAVGVPMGWRLAGDTWIYTNPSVGLRPSSTARLPLGLGIGFAEGARVDTEVFAAWTPNCCGWRDQVQYGAALGFAWRWRTARAQQKKAEETPLPNW